jgi:hypothetical protein
MADIDQIIAGGSGATSRADFSGLADIPDAYWKGKDRRYTQESRDLFKDGVPKNADGTIDYGAMRDALFKQGQLTQGTAIDNLDLERQRLKFGQQQSQGIQTFEQGGQPAIVSPPSPNRSASTPVAPPLNRGGVDNQAQSGPGGARAGGTSIMQILSAQGIPNDQLQAASASIARQIGVDDPTQPIDTNDPRIRNVLVPAVQNLKRAGVGRVIPEGEASPPDQALPQPTQVMGPRGAAQPNAQGVYPANAVMMPTEQPPVVAQGGHPSPAPVAQRGQPGPVTNAVTGQSAPAAPSRIDQAIAYYAGIMSNPMSPKQNVELAKTRLESMQKSVELTPAQKDYAQAVTQGFRGTQDEHAAKVEADKAYATENTKSYIKKYDAIQTAGARARMDIPQLDLARKLTEDPNFYSGVGEKYNLLLKRAVTALGGDPNTAAPQEAFRKIVSNSILDQIKSMAGTGQIRVAEIKIMEQAAANAENTPQANRLLLELSSRLQKRAAAISDMAQSYNGGRLDSGFDRKVAAYDRANPMISDKEIPDFRKIISSPKEREAAPAGQPKFGSPSDVRAAVSAGKLKSGDAFTDANGKTRYVP